MKCSSVVVLKGVVQGVGFRPWVYRVAQLHNLKGWVLNSREGLITHLEGKKAEIGFFVREVKRNPPPLSRIDSVEIKDAELVGYSDFTIRKSEEDVDKVTLISPDIAVCGDCLREVFDPEDRRFRYPFTNCTNCGPRVSIIVDTPYDRSRTSMSKFTLCEQCAQEYEDPLNRRFHAQPNACPKCGPSVRLLGSDGIPLVEKDPIVRTAGLLREGEIVGIKGIGGFHIAVDAKNSQAVEELRRRKSRPHKPFALMVKDVETARRYCHVNQGEEKWLESPEAPILLLKKKSTAIASEIAPECAPGNPYLGVMLPYTPLHALIFSAGSPDALVMTSGNRKDEPLVINDVEVLEKLDGVVDYVLSHNRDIVTRNDDSVAVVVDRKLRALRRSRGLAPYPVQLPLPVKSTLAYGAELKNTFCLAQGKRAFVSSHVGDLVNMETSLLFEELTEKWRRWFLIEPEIVAHDLHPGYLSTRYAKHAQAPKIVGVQHHFAHVASCMAENGLESRVIGVAFDGTGYGIDGKIWGCEFLVGDYAHFERKAHLRYLPLPGGDAAIKKPYRTAIAYLSYLLSGGGTSLFEGRVNEEELRIVQEQVKREVFTPFTSSCGRLFDAVASILGICDTISFEAQAAMALEFVAEERLGTPYEYDVVEDGKGFIVDPRKLIEEIVRDCKNHVSPREISRRFHATIVEFSVEVCSLLRESDNIGGVVLSGGVFQNLLLLGGVSRRLRENGFEVYTHSRVPTNDGGISLGQVMIANSQPRGQVLHYHIR